MKLGTTLATTLALGLCAAAALAAAPAPKAKRPAAPRAHPLTPNAQRPTPDAPPVSPEAAEFFETNVRPVLSQSCFSCHGPKMQQAGLRLDSLAAALKGTDKNQPAIVPGDPDRSPLIQALRYDGAVKMPPQGKLPDKAIAALTQWVKMGAPWPGASRQTAGGSAADPAKHWAWQPVRKPALPSVKSAAWVKSPVDSFVLAKLEAKGLAPNRPADRRTLIRRATDDLIGLPPTQAEIDAFAADKSPNAFEKVVDRLLASPHYGERWARYWLDVARYADTKGYVFQEERRYPYAYTYRDWVINALNDDLPYDQFLVQQIAADQLPLGDDKRALAAMGFLTLGRRFLNNTPDIVDDRMDVVFRGTQGLTVGCARCHDHKFDPIPIKDYYSLYGVFANSTEPADLPLITTPKRTEAYVAFEKRLGELQAQVQRFKETRYNELIAQARAKIGLSLLAAREAAKPGADFRAVAQKYDLPGGLIRRWKDFLDDTDREKHPVFGPWVKLAALPDDEWSAKAPALMATLSANQGTQTQINARVAELFSNPAPASLQEAAERLGKLLAQPPAEDDQLVHALDSIGGPLNIEVGQVEQLFNRDDRNKLQELQMQVESFKATSPEAPPRAMVLNDVLNPGEPRVFLRGNPNNRGEQINRHFLTVLAGPNPKPFTKGSGRLELAQAIASKENPLTARVMVNRVWMYHFGAPLVRTPSDFGTRSEPPTHPELLDYLASRFMEEGWSLKKLHRLMLLSSTYQTSSAENPRSSKVDPENSLLWRMRRRRLDFEAMRDSILAASGKLDRTVGGPSVELTTRPFTTRRAAYGFIDRQNLPGLFRTFDFATPDATSPMRFTTTVPQQALFLMNSPFVVEQARALAARPEVASQKSAEGKVQQLYRLAYGRAATAKEVELSLRFLKSLEGTPSAAPETAPKLWDYGCGEVDEATGRLKGFQPLQRHGAAYQGGPELPDAKVGWVSLSAIGGHPGDPQHAAVRRWIAPKDGVVRIVGAIKHAEERGDGIRARIVSSRSGVLGTWMAHNQRVEGGVERVEVKKGDTLDFVVDCRGSVDYDSFTWSPAIRLLDPGDPAGTAIAAEWRASQEFDTAAPEAAPALSAWEKYAQVLLISNEFMFVD
jgi:hypothetical protein